MSKLESANVFFAHDFDTRKPSPPLTLQQKTEKLEEKKKNPLEFSLSWLAQVCLQT